MVIKIYALWEFFLVPIRNDTYTHIHTVDAQASHQTSFSRGWERHWSFMGQIRSHPAGQAK